MTALTLPRLVSRYAIKQDKFQIFLARQLFVENSRDSNVLESYHETSVQIESLSQQKKAVWFKG
jgi:hypothetical protein